MRNGYNAKLLRKINQVAFVADKSYIERLDLATTKILHMTYKVSAVGTIAGCMVKDGKVSRDAQVRVLRDNIVIHQGEVGSLQRFKDAAKEVTAGYECGMSILKFNDIKEGDIFECFVMEEIKQ